MSLKALVEKRNALLEEAKSILDKVELEVRALTNEENIPIEIIRKAVASFEGVKRRFEYLGKTKSGAFVYDDYAHHPTEVAATLQGFRDTFPDKRLIVAFQPHLFSRTRDHYETFGSVFSNCDELLVCDIYPARELPIEGVTGELISKSAQERGHRDARFVGEKENIAMQKSAKIIHQALQESVLHVLPELYHGEFSINKGIDYANKIREINGY